MYTSLYFLYYDLNLCLIEFFIGSAVTDGETTKSQTSDLFVNVRNTESSCSRFLIKSGPEPMPR